MSETVDPALVAVRFFAYGLAMLAFGRASFDVYATEPRPGRSPLLAAASALLALAALAYAVLLAREASGAAGWPDAAAVAMVCSATGFGRALTVSAAAALALALLELAARQLRWPKLALAAVALGALAFVGHGADDTGLRGGVRLAVLAVHLLAVAAWLGALPALWSALARERRPLALLDRFGWVGGVSLALVLVTGCATLVFVALDARGGLGRGYVQTLVLKLAFVGGLLVLAAVNRFRLTPMMARAPERARRMLRASIIAEQVLGLGALASVALLGQLDPTM
ncbi:MAG TPA: CopD family protein [Caulobacteraceae bacterium]|nr:CopD family protein [Caulobacteraceae bacterium]